jgi:hypothetical protein
MYGHQQKHILTVYHSVFSIYTPLPSCSAQEPRPVLSIPATNIHPSLFAVQKSGSPVVHGDWVSNGKFPWPVTSKANFFDGM